MSAMSCFGVALIVFCGVLLAWGLEAPACLAYSLTLSGPQHAAGSSFAYTVGALSGITLGAILALVGARGNKEQVED